MPTPKRITAAAAINEQGEWMIMGSSGADFDQAKAFCLELLGGRVIRCYRVRGRLTMPSHHEAELELEPLETVHRSSPGLVRRWFKRLLWPHNVGVEKSA